ncbi:MAG: GNAT family N-acetyltransferase [Candidatus Latescibacteria bacterium]|nr:GNAT family N-acetyltransferase [Candidatus Latescibacterota bacterium]NIO78139.1 GNAT family N-acetyltransferase [Candidatus Latescibacterota bacterium]
MGPVAVRQLKAADLPFAFRLNLAERWNDQFSDVERMFQFEPDGGFIAEAEGRPVGHVFSISYGGLGWIGLLIVEPKYRRRGIGTLLAVRVKDYLLSRGVQTIKLESVAEIADLYRQIGFVDEYDSLRLKRTAERLPPKGGNAVRSITKGDLSELVVFDAKYFGADRRRVLGKLYEASPQLCFIAHTGTNVAGYVMCRKAHIGYNLGPLACIPQHPETASDLVRKCVGRLNSGAEIFVGVPAVNRAATQMWNELGFSEYSRSIRMRLGKDLEHECVDGIFAIAGPMKG